MVLYSPLLLTRTIRRRCVCVDVDAAVICSTRKTGQEIVAHQDKRAPLKGLQKPEDTANQPTDGTYPAVFIAMARDRQLQRAQHRESVGVDAIQLSNSLNLIYPNWLSIEREREALRFVEKQVGRNESNKLTVQITAIQSG